MAKRKITVAPLTETIYEAIKKLGRTDFEVRLDGDRWGTGVEYMTMTGRDVKVEVAVDTGYIREIKHATGAKPNVVTAYASYTHIPGTNMYHEENFKGCLVQDFNKPEAVVNASVYADIFDKAQNLFNKLADLFQTEVA